jgi:hypothetical protein
MSAVTIIPPAAGLTDTNGYRGGVPVHYDPTEGLKAIVVAEAAAKHYERAKDAAQLFGAVQAKLGEQRRFVLWWDAQEKHPEPMEASDERVDSWSLRNRPKEQPDGQRADAGAGHGAGS